MSTTPPDAPARARSPRDVNDEPARADRFFGLATTTSGVVVLVLMVLVGLFLLLRSSEAFDLMGFRFFTTVE